MQDNKILVEKYIKQMKSKRKKEGSTPEKVQENNYIAFISGIVAFASFLTSIIFVLDFIDNIFDCKSEDNKSSDKSSLSIAVFFKILTIISGYIYVKEAQDKNDDQSDIWHTLKEFFGATGEQALQLFINGELIGVDKNAEE